MSNETSQETWNATHGQLLKSVADAQAKLLAAQNETCDKVESTSRNLGLAEKRLTDRLADLPLLAAKLDAIGTMLAKLAPPRRQVERLRTKRIVKRATPERKRGR